MPHDFSYGAGDGNGRDGAGPRPSVSAFADRPYVLRQFADDAEASGLPCQHLGDLDAFLGVEGNVFGDIILIDCPSPNGQMISALHSFDVFAQQSAKPVIVSTNAAGLDAVFGAMAISRPQILVDPSDAERAIALGIVLSSAGVHTLRELGEHDRLLLVRLTEQVGKMAERLDVLDKKGVTQDGGAFRFQSPSAAFDAQDSSAPYITSRPDRALPDPKFVRRILRNRRRRDEYFDHGLFADPAWDMLLDLCAAKLEGVKVSVSSLCIAACVPPTTALRWIGQMVDAGLLVRVEDESDKRRVFIGLSVKCDHALMRYFSNIERDTPQIL